MLSFVKGCMHVRPVTPTLSWDVLHEGDAKPFTALPAEPSSLPACDFAKFFRQGLTVLPDEELQVGINISFSEQKCLPFYMFPVMHYPVLVRMVQSGWIMAMPAVFELQQDDSLFMHTSEHFHARDTQTYCTRVVEQEQAWFGEFANVHELSRTAADSPAAARPQRARSLLHVRGHTAHHGPMGQA